MDAWVWWLIAAAVLAVVEVLTVDLVAIMLAGGAAAAAIASAVGAPAPVSFLVFAAVSALLLLVLRPVAKRHLTRGPVLRSGTDALRGQQALVLERVDGRDGRVKLGGEIWSARAYDETSAYDVGTSVQVIAISGATALVG
ncbi:MAG: NfeD family protein [Actinomycetota bacterium]|nr:MAG: NfeD family protein [Actinomycetota bacterium]